MSRRRPAWMQRPLPPLPPGYRSMIWTDPWDEIRPEFSRLSAVNQRPVAHHGTRFVDPYSHATPSEIAAVVADEQPELEGLLAEVDALVAERAPPVAAGSKQMLPIMDPAHNYREISKQLLLLEDHLFHPKKDCPDCIRKHLLTSEALAEEAVTLDKGQVYGAIHRWLPDEIRGFEREVIAGRMSHPVLAQSVRQVRKRLSRLSFSALPDPEGSQNRATGDPELAEARRQAKLARIRARTMRAEARTAAAKRRAAQAELVALRKEKRADRIADRLGVVHFDSSEKKPLERLAEREAQARANPFAVGLSGGEPVIYAWRQVVSEGKRSKLEGWHEGNIALTGTKCGPNKEEVESYPQGGWLAVEVNPVQTPGGEGACFWVDPVEVMPLPRDKVGRPKRLSSVFAPFGKIALYVPGRVGSVRLNAQRLVMIDLIYAVMLRKLTGALPARVVEDVAKAAVINAAYESALDADAVGDEGLSVGLFQLSARGVGTGMTTEQRQNPIINTIKISDEFLRRLDQVTEDRKACPPVQQRLIVLARRARAAQSAGELPTVAQWTAAFAAQVECPRSPTAPSRRARTATELFGGAPLAVIPRRGVPMPVPVPALPAVSDETKTALVYAAGASLLAAAVTAVVLSRNR